MKKLLTAVHDNKPHKPFVFAHEYGRLVVFETTPKKAVQKARLVANGMPIRPMFAASIEARV